MKKRKQIIVCIISLTLIVCFCGIYVMQGFAVPLDKCHKRIINAFYNEGKNSLDGVYIGPSSVTRYWIPSLAFREEGLAISGLATTGQPFVLVEYLMREAKKTQNDALFIIELRNVFKEPADIHEVNIRRVTDNLKPSFNRLRAAHAGLEYMAVGENNVGGSALAVYFPALETAKRKLNGTLSETVSFSGNPAESWNKGFLFSPSTFKAKKMPESRYNTKEKAVLEPENEAALLSLLDYCDSVDNEVLFVLSPWVATKNDYPCVNTAIEIVESRGYTVLNMNTEKMIEIIGIDWETDFYNKRHTNLYGAEKYTRYLANYIDDKYNFDDHRNEAGFEDWHESCSLYDQRVKEETN